MGTFDLFLIDKDECQSGEFECDMNAECINTIGSYDCRCVPPYFGDGSVGNCFRKDLAIIIFNNEHHIVSGF